MGGTCGGSKTANALSPSSVFDVTGIDLDFDLDFDFAAAAVAAAGVLERERASEVPVGPGRSR
jgi:hypothetical protein